MCDYLIRMLRDVSFSDDSIDQDTYSVGARQTGHKQNSFSPPQIGKKRSRQGPLVSLEILGNQIRRKELFKTMMLETYIIAFSVVLKKPTFDCIVQNILLGRTNSESCTVCVELNGAAHLLDSHAVRQR